MAKIRFEPDAIEVEVPAGTSILEAAQDSGAQLGSACGGVCACSTCHIYVREGSSDLPEAEEAEEDILDKAFDVRPSSRLACQSKVSADGLYVVEITPESRKAYLDEHPDER